MMKTQHARGWDDGPGHHRRTPRQALQARTPGHHRAPALSWANLGINFDDLDWQSEANCRSTDPDAFFPDLEYGGDVATVKRICHACPVRADCLNYALARPGLVGIWGGLSTRERRNARVRHQQREEAA